MDLYTYLDQFDLSATERTIAYRLTRADSATTGAFSVSADYSVGDLPRWRAAALDAAQAIAREARYLLDDLRELRVSDGLLPGERDKVLDLAADLRHRVADLRHRAAA